jgi:hypothetical protein
MHELLESPALPVLPASLLALRLETAGTLNVSAEGRPEGLASDTISVLDLRAGVLSCSYLSADAADDRHASAPAKTADLPPGFQALWLRTGCIALGSAGYEGGGGSAVTGVDVAEELSRFLGLAPQSYREFHLFAVGGGESSALSIEAEWLPTPDDAMECSTGSFASLDAVAEAMQMFASAHGLSVNITDDHAHLRVVRTEAAGQA